MNKRSKPRLGVAVLVTDHSGRLLLGRRGKTPNYGKWIVPGGGVKFMESIYNTAAREIREETGLDIEICNPEKQSLYVEEIIIPATRTIDQDEHRVIIYVNAQVEKLTTLAKHMGKPFTLPADSDLVEARFFCQSDIPVSELSDVTKRILKKTHWISAD